MSRKIGGGPSIGATLDSALAAAGDSSAKTLCVSMCAPGLDALTFQELGKREKVVWIPGDGQEHFDNRWEVFGIGEGISLKAAGPDRFTIIKDAAMGEFRQVEHLVDERLEHCPTMRFHGGGKFASGGEDAMWDTFTDARFVVPRWQYMRNGSKTLLRLVIDRELFLGQGSWAEEAELVADWLNNGPENGAPPGASMMAVEHDPPAWTNLVTSALAAIGEGKFEKVVVSRTSRVEGDRSFSLPRMLERHARYYPGCVRFVQGFGGGLFTGVTPEQLVTVHSDGRVVEADALAGSIERGSVGTDEESVKRLMGSYKNRREFEYVLNDLVGRLGDMGVKVYDHVPLKVRSLKDVHHLHSHIVGESDDPVHVLDAVRTLHPTPAVCGTPTAAAMGWLEKNEPWDRGWYSGPIGWFDENGEGDFAVAIRSALLTGHTAQVFAGCGIVNGSVPQVEYEETRIKQLAMLSAMGVK